LRKPPNSPNASRAYTYGPPEPGTRRDSAPNVSANATAPIVTSTKATRLIGPYGANAVGSANTPIPITDPRTRAVAVGSPNWPPPARAPLSVFRIDVTGPTSCDGGPATSGPHHRGPERRLHAMPRVTLRNWVLRHRVGTDATSLAAPAAPGVTALGWCRRVGVGGGLRRD
jgi:hypothetical protein